MQAKRMGQSKGVYHEDRPDDILQLNHVELIGRVLKESMDTIFPYEKIRDETSQTSTRRYVDHRISVPDGSTITVKKTIADNPYYGVGEGAERELDVKFEVDDPKEGKSSQDLTGKNEHKFGILNTVKHITKETAKEHGVDTVKYSVASEPRGKRMRLYDKIAGRAGAERLPGYGSPRLKIKA